MNPNEPKRHPAAIALDEWLKLAESKRDYSENMKERCRAAFLDGWHACERHHGLKR